MEHSASVLHVKHLLPAGWLSLFIHFTLRLLQRPQLVPGDRRVFFAVCELLVKLGSKA